MYVHETLGVHARDEEGSGTGITTEGDQESKRLAGSTLVQQFPPVMFLGDTELKTGYFYPLKCLFLSCAPPV